MTPKPQPMPPRTREPLRQSERSRLVPDGCSLFALPWFKVSPALETALRELMKR